jgi:heptosyltransferase-1
MLDLPARPRRIVLIKPSALGDVVNALPVLTGIRRLFPGAHVAWLVHSAYADLLEGHPHLDQVIRFDRGSAQRGLRAGWQALRTLHRALLVQRFDLAIDLQGLFRSGLMTWWTGANVRIGLGEAREGSAFFYTHTLKRLKGIHHAVDRYWRVVTTLGGAGLTKEFIVPRRVEAEHWADAQLIRWPRPWIVINLGTRWETKRWPVPHFFALSQSLRQRHGGSRILVGGPGEEHLGAEFAKLDSSAVVDLTGRTTLPQLASVLARADLVLTNDSGPMHLAAALGRPVVAPFTCTDPCKNGPYGQLAHTACTQLPCAASYLKKCGHLSCMQELAPSRLLPLADTILASWQKRSA